MVLRFLLLAVVALTLLLGRTGAAGESSASSNGLIAFIRAGVESGAESTLYVLDPSNGESRRLTSAIDSWQPSWSPDGRLLAFIGAMKGEDNYLFVMNADGSDLRRLVRAGSTGAWSPDGSKIAYAHRGRDELDELRIVDVDTGRVKTVLISDRGLDNESVSWSPDGKALLFISSSDQGPYSLFEVNPDGKNLRVIGSEASFGFAWSPSGQRIAYAGLGNQEDLDIISVRADGSDERNLTIGSPEIESFPAWSPDGTMIAFLVPAESELRIVDSDGRNLRTIATGNGPPAWSPDGTKLVYEVEKRDKNGNILGVELHTIDVDGRNEVNLIPNSDFSGSPSWQRLPAGQSAPILPEGVQEEVQQPAEVVGPTQPGEVEAQPEALAETIPPTTGDGGLLQPASRKGPPNLWLVSILLLSVALGFAPHLRRRRR